jgi:hypothetical protein
VFSYLICPDTISDGGTPNPKKQPKKGGGTSNKTYTAKYSDGKFFITQRFWILEGLLAIYFLGVMTMNPD